MDNVNLVNHVLRNLLKPKRIWPRKRTWYFICVSFNVAVVWPRKARFYAKHLNVFLLCVDTLYQLRPSYHGIYTQRIFCVAFFNLLILSRPNTIQTLCINTAASSTFKIISKMYHATTAQAALNTFNLPNCERDIRLTSPAVYYLSKDYLLSEIIIKRFNVFIFCNS